MVSVLTLPQIIAQPFAADGDKNTIPNDATGTQNASLEEGFPEVTEKSIATGGIPPVRKDFNGAINLMSQFYFFTQNGGTYTFNQTVSDALGGYPLNAVLWYFGTDGTKTMVVSNIANNGYNFVNNPDYIGDNSKPWSMISTEKSNLPMGTIVYYDSPSDDFGLEPLNDQSYQGGKVISGDTYPNFWDFCLTRKQAAGNDPRYSRYNHTQAEYNAELASKGFCGWYVIDEVNKTIRLPFYGSAFLQGYTGGDVDKQAGLPNIKGGYTNLSMNSWSQINDIGALYHTNEYGWNPEVGDSPGGRCNRCLGLDASRSSPIYGRSSTVQPNAVAGYYYVVVATVATSISAAEWDAKQDKSNLVTSISAQSTDTQYPSAKCVYDIVGDIESLLSTI